MRLRQAMTIPVVAAIALGGAVAFGGCGSDSNVATGESTTDSRHRAAMKHDGESMKHKGGAMKHDGDAMKHQGDSMNHQDKGMQHDGSSGDHMEG